MIFLPDLLVGNQLINYWFSSSTTYDIQNRNIVYFSLHKPMINLFHVTLKFRNL